MKEQIDIKDVLLKHNSKKENASGCIFGFLNIILIIIYILCFFAVLGTYLLSGINGVSKILTSIIIFSIVCTLVNICIKKLLNKKGGRLNSTFSGNVKVKILEGKVVGHRIETEQSTQTERDIIGIDRQFYRDYYLQIEIDGIVKELNLDIDIYSKLKKDDEIYLIEVNDLFHSDMIFKRNDYELNSESLKALNNEIIINI